MPAPTHPAPTAPAPTTPEPTDHAPTIAVLGAAGLIGGALAAELRRAGFPVVAVARRLTPAQRHRFGATAVEAPFAALDPTALRALLDRHGAALVVNCVGVLQDSRPGESDAVHRAFVERLVAALEPGPGRAPRLLVHLSVPGAPEADGTAFSRTKRAGEGVIAASRVPFAILRPGFVVAPAAFGGSALVRALAALPVALPAREAGRPFATVAVADIAGTVAVLARRWGAGERRWTATWDLMAPGTETVGSVVAGFRAWIGGPRPRFRLPAPLLNLGARSGDLAARLGWRPPIRSTALAEMRRGVAGDPGPWMRATGIAPLPLAASLAALDPSVQERWFGRLYLLKPLVLGGLAAFWIVSGLVGLTAGFEAAAGILLAHGFPPGAARAVTALTSLGDVAVGAAIAARPTCRAGLVAGVVLALSYLAAAAVVTPELWADPLGALVKTGPALVLMLVGLAMLDDR